MAEIIFTCPSCSQSIAGDDSWAGQQVQCPTCQTVVVVPGPAAPPARGQQQSSLVPKVPESSTPRLSLGAHATSKPAPMDRKIPIRDFTAPPRKQQGLLTKILAPLAILVVLGVLAYFAYPYVSAKLKKSGEAFKQATGDAPAETAPAPTPAPAEPAVEKPLPVVAPSYTLDLAAAQIPESRVNGLLSGTNFLPESARLDIVGTAHVLRFTEGSLLSPDREILIYLHAKPGESVAGQNLEITPDKKGAGVPQVTKRWKISPRYAPSLKSYSSGYALKLELGQANAEGALPGKFYLALPDNEKSVIAGVFKAATNAAPAVAQQPQPTPGVPTAAPTPEQTAERAMFEKRYGIKR